MGLCLPVVYSSPNKWVDAGFPGCPPHVGFTACSRPLDISRLCTLCSAAPSPCSPFTLGPANAARCSTAAAAAAPAPSACCALHIRSVTCSRNLRSPKSALLTLPGGGRGGQHSALPCPHFHLSPPLSCRWPPMWALEQSCTPGGALGRSWAAAAASLATMCREPAQQPASSAPSWAACQLSS